MTSSVITLRSAVVGGVEEAPERPHVAVVGLMRR